MQSVSVKVGEHDLVFETGRLAKQANGAILATYGGSAVLATACCSSSPMEDLDFVPLQVEYNEKFYAAGKIPGGFPRREGRPKDKEILVCRLIDRPMRPLFSKAFKREIQVVPTVMSSDVINPPDIVAMCASSAAVTISDIPFDGPVAAVRISSVDGTLVVNPTFDQISDGDLDIIVAGTMSGITMVEGGSDEVSEERLLEAIELAESNIKNICEAQIELAKLAGKEKLPLVEIDDSFSLQNEIREFAFPKLQEACFVIGKHKRYAAMKAVKEETLAKFSDGFEEGDAKKANTLFEEMETEIVRKSILKDKKRTDGRGLEDIRPISCDVEILQRTHGSALFTRGETQALAVTTLGTVSDEKLVDDIDGEKRYQSFMLHYNFPPFSVGETGRMGTGRREIGHGHLAQRAIEAVLPQKDDFPYTIRIVSEVLESNGSSSMATVCGSSLSLLDAGVPIKKPVAGIAMGLVSEGDEAAILSDILGEEDHLGDMDFKVAGTEDGITAFQMDIKIAGISSELMKRAMAQAKQGRMHILGIMNETTTTPREGLSKFAPRIETVQVDPDKLGAVIGSGGKVVKSISEQTKTQINIEDTGVITIFGREQEGVAKAIEYINGIVAEPEVGRVYDGVVKRIMDFGAFIEFLPGKEGLCHISRLARERVNKVDDVLKLGQEIPVKIIEVDRMGRINLSYIDAIDPDGAPASRPPRQDHQNRGERPPRQRDRG